MGIEQFYFAIRKKLGKNEIPFETKLNEATHLYIDFNASIHKISEKTIFELNKEYFERYDDDPEACELWRQSYDEEKINDIVMNNVIDDLNKIIIGAKSAKEVYIGFDGTPEINKCLEQKNRKITGHFMSTIDESINEHYGIVNNKFKFNKGEISAYTNFMSKLVKKIKKKYIEYEGIIISGVDEYGEGEKKIINWMFNNSVVRNNDIILILSPDADVILLACIAMYKFHIKGIKPNIFVNNREIIDINELSIHLSRHVGLSINDNNENILKDFVFIFTMFGNDFLPKIMSMSNVGNNIDLFIELYKLMDPNEYFINQVANNKFEINYEKLIKFFQLLSVRENHLYGDYIEFKKNDAKRRFKISYYDCAVHICDNIEHYYGFNKQYGNKYKNSHELRDIVEMNKKDELLYAMGIVDYVNEKFTIYDYECIAFKYKKSAWKIILNDYEYTTEEQEYDEIQIRDYIDGLVWVTDWYFNRMYSNTDMISTWFYPHRYAPSFKNIVSYLSKNIIQPSNNIYSFVHPSEYFTKKEHKKYVEPSKNEKIDLQKYVNHVMQTLYELKINYSTDEPHVVKKIIGNKLKSNYIDCHHARYMNKCHIKYNVQTYDEFINDIRRES